MFWILSGDTPETSYLGHTTTGINTSEVVANEKDVHDGKDTTLNLGSLTHSIPNFIPQVANAMIPCLDLALTREPL